MNPYPNAGYTGPRGTPCSESLTRLAAESLSAWPEVVTSLLRVSAALDGREDPHVAGAPVTTLEWFTSVRSLVALSLASTEPDEFGELPPALYGAVVSHWDEMEGRAATRQGMRKAGGDPRKGPRTRTWQKPPSVALVAACAPLAVGALGSADRGAAVEVLTPLFDRVRQRVPLDPRSVVATHTGIPQVLRDLYEATIEEELSPSLRHGLAVPRPGGATGSGRTGTSPRGREPAFTQGGELERRSDVGLSELRKITNNLVVRHAPS